MASNPSGEAARARMRFSHPLLKQVGYEVQLRSDRRRRHRVIAETLEARSLADAERTPLDALADHWDGAMEPGALDANEIAEKVARYSAAAAEQLDATAQYGAGLARCRRGLAVLPEGAAPGLRVDLFRETGLLYLRLARVDEAGVAIRQGFQVLESHSGIPAGVESALGTAAAELELFKGRPSEALERAIRAESVANSVRSDRLRILAKRQVAGALLYLGRAAEAHASFEDGLRLAERLNDRRLVNAAHSNLAMAEHALGHLREARSRAEAALQSSEALSDARAVATLCSNLAYLCQDLDDISAARDYALRAARRAAAIGARAVETSAYATLGSLLSQIGEHGEAHAMLDRALAIAIETSHEILRATVLQMRGSLFCDEERWADAEEPLLRSLAYFRERGDSRLAAFCGGALARANAGLGRLEEAFSLLETAEEDGRSCRAPDAEFSTLLSRVEVAARALLGDPRRVKSEWLTAADEAVRRAAAERPDYEWMARAWRYRLCAAGGGGGRLPSPDLCGDELEAARRAIRDRAVRLGASGEAFLKIPLARQILAGTAAT